MPNVGSWNGQWGGAGRNYTIVRRLSPADVERLELPRSFYHNFGDGWGASVSARVMKRGERAAKSDGFCGYDWMVDRIIRWGDTQCRHEWERDPQSGKPGWPGEWQRCRLCHESKRVDNTDTILREVEKGMDDDDERQARMDQDLCQMEGESK